GPDPPSPPARVDTDLHGIDAGLSRPPRRAETADPHQLLLLQSHPLFSLMIRGRIAALLPVAREGQGKTIRLLLVVDLNDARIVTAGTGPESECAGRWDDSHYPGLPFPSTRCKSDLHYLSLTGPGGTRRTSTYGEIFKELCGRPSPSPA